FNVNTDLTQVCFRWQCPKKVSVISQYEQCIEVYLHNNGDSVSKILGNQFLSGFRCSERLTQEYETGHRWRYSIWGRRTLKGLWPAYKKQPTYRDTRSIVKNFLSLEAEEAGESDFEEDENEIDDAQFIDDAVRDDSICGSSSSSLSLTAKPDHTPWLDPVIQKYGGSVSEDRTSTVSETSSHVFDPHSPNLPVSPMRTSTTMDSSITSAPQTACPAPPSTSSIPSTPLPAPSMQSSITSHRLVPPASSALTEDALRLFDVTFSALSQEDDDEDDDEAMVTSGDPVLMNLLDELVQQSEDVSLFQVYSVHCCLGTENNIVGRIREDIKQGSISSNVINDAFPSKIPGRVYLVVLNMHRQNTTLAAYLSSIDGFKYRNSRRLPTKEVITGTRLRTRDDGTTYMTHTSSVPPIHQSLSLDMPISTWVPYNDTYFSRLHRRHEFIKPGTWVQPKRGLFKGDIREELYGAPFGTEGTVQSVEDTHCEVCVSLTEAPVSKIVRVPINALLKKIAVGDTVEI
ncbi:hypothetical protein F5890DRAFT_1479293, partial [Lentinula detonsa]